MKKESTTDVNDNNKNQIVITSSNNATMLTATTKFPKSTTLNNFDDSDLSTTSLSSSNHTASTYDYNDDDELSSSRQSLEDEKDDEHSIGRIQSYLSLTSAVSITISFSRIPIVDLSSSPQVIIESVQRACREVGFMYIVNHGLSSTLSDKMFDLSRLFFSALDKETKMQIENKKSKSGARGYFFVGSENLDPSMGVEGDWKEGFDCGRDDITEEECQEHSMVDTNQWPTTSTEDFDVNEFRRGVMGYQTEAMKVAHTLLSYVAIGLDCPSNFFSERMLKPMVTLRLLHYPPLSINKEEEKENTTTPKREEKMGCGAHTDYGCCTILNQDSTGGLEIYNKFTSNWIDAPPVPGSLVINLGDMMQRWTNEVYPSTIHRVKLNKKSQQSRYSIPFFVNPDVGTIVQCLSSCDTTNAKYPPERSEEILRKRWDDAFSKNIKKVGNR